MRLFLLGLFACQERIDSEDTSAVVEFSEDTGSEVENECTAPDYTPNPFASEVISISYGEGAGFGQDNYPDVIFGAPTGRGENAGTLDVLSLGAGGEIVLSFDMEIVDGEGVDLLVFENPFIGWMEFGLVSASQDGETWVEWSCNMETFSGCAGVSPVYSHPDNCIDARDPAVAGGDGFDLANIGLESARYIRITDANTSGLGGFDLDAVAVVNGVLIAE